MNSKYQICVVGSASFDLFLIVHHFPAEGETLQSEDSFIKNGGKGANQAVASAKLGAKTVFAGQFGQDKHGDNLTSEMTHFGVNLSYLRRIKECQTGQAIIMLNKQGQNSIIIVGGANTFYKELNIIPNEYIEAINSSQILLLQKEIPIEITTLCAVYAKSAHKLVMLDCGGRDEDIPNKLLENLDFISPNETELARLINQPVPAENESVSIETIRTLLLKKYPNIVTVLKLGSKGSAILTQNQYIEVKSVSLLNPKILQDFKIVDTTGAGDCFTSAFCVKYIEILNKEVMIEPSKINEIYKQCLLFANASAFICITVMGAMPSMPLRSVVEDFSAKYLNDVKL